jgi:toxin YoeB
MAYKIELNQKTFDELATLRKSDKNDYTKCFDLLLAIAFNPFDGTGHPERLKYQEDEEVWSRKINKKDMVVYAVDKANEIVTILSCVGHYDDH